MTPRTAARHYMVRNVITVTPDLDIHRATRLLIDNGISGAPVLDDGGRLVGVLSTRDCLKVTFSSSYHQERGGPVADFMSREPETVDADTDIVEIAGLFLRSRYRRFPVMSNGRMVGLISRSDVLKALEDLW